MNNVPVFLDRRLLIACLLLGGLSGCADFNRIYGTPSRQPAPVYGNYPEAYPRETYRAPSPAERPAARPYVAQPPAPPREAASSPAVAALLAQAETIRQSGDLGAAVATAERALRIEPRNAKLIHVLAELRLQQDLPKEAEDLAKKSNVLAGGDRELIRKNWLIIASARRRFGDTRGAAEAEARARGN